MRARKDPETLKKNTARVDTWRNLPWERSQGVTSYLNIKKKKKKKKKTLR
eukprot:NODE_4667_length_266_cov_407.050691_g3996_i0.p2 GENE.NODE_4667_length_266_cov_407.050691_g3996_i0~~NODE_4667_length_266_cov_407.050691_g3996_i0.p2  ORF type:complete len:50 (+),score=9.26 NODE_4667_length_266_cov_407.050691_g3996_i0:114-263(+)